MEKFRYNEQQQKYQQTSKMVSSFVKIALILNKLGEVEQQMEELLAKKDMVLGDLESSKKHLETRQNMVTIKQAELEQKEQSLHDIQQSSQQLKS